MERKVFVGRDQRVTRLRLPVAIVAAIAVLVMAAPSARAGTVAGTGGSTEITQLLNNAQLIKQNASEINTVRNTLQSAMYLKQTLRQLDPATIARLAGVPIDQVRALATMDNQLGGLMDSEQSVQAILSNTASSAQGMHMTPMQFLQYRANQAHQMGGVYAQSFNSDRQSMRSMQDQISALQATAASTPAVVSQVQGLQQLLVQNTQVQASLLSLNESVTKANALAAMKGKQEYATREAQSQAEAANEQAAKALQQETVTLPDPTKYGPDHR